MDLLGSILNSMDKPPSLSEKQKTLIRRQKEEVEKRQKVEKEKLRKFKENVEERINKHFEDKYNIDMKFEPMDKIQRTIVHDLAESAGFLSYAFGEDGVDRHVRIYRKENPPCDDELSARRRGEEWNDEIKQHVMERREQEKRNQAIERRRKPEIIMPNSNYKDKYAHLIGQDSALEAAKKTETNKTYGFVPSENKKDIRSIEQTMADIQAKKRLKTDHNSTSK
ncbi:sperm-associated antigen 7 [Chrysoperla carnea]|uniref:sperm-associated antigen 7 n=1 Tax=Chrysoperla carnea TaxID=189513 RepID=UPI001D085AAC|nr:sperm-associated antigen 7 [Chrysoperla carnea]